MTRSSKSHRPAALALEAIALAWPETTLEKPWGHPAYKVRGKAFMFAGNHDQMPWSCSLKLPLTHPFALGLPFCTPTGYGLGKSGWVSCTFGPDDDVPVDILKVWLEESFRAIAPKTVLKTVDAATMGPTDESRVASPAKKAATKKTATKKTATKKTATKKTAAKKTAAKKTAAKKTAAKKTPTKKTAAKKT